MTIRKQSLVLVLVVALALCGCGDRQTSDSTFQNGVVASSSPIASAVGAEILSRGGNAFDAAVAVGFTLAVVHPKAGNIGGGGFAVVRDGKTGQVRALDFRETAPSTAHETMYLDEDGEVIEDLSMEGALASGIPGTVAGLHALWTSHGTLPWDDLVAPSMALADTGFVVSSALAGHFEDYQARLRQYPETSGLYLHDGVAPKAGERLVLPDLSRTLREIQMKGPDGFYAGWVADSIVACMQRHGGMISKDDLTSFKTVWREPILFEFDSLAIYSMPPPSSGGILLGQILGILEPFDFSGMAPDSPEFVHLFCEAARLAFADRSVHLADPEFWNVPSGLLNDDYITARRARLSLDRAGASDEIGPGDPSVFESDETTHYSVCDRAGNVVALTTTLNNSFGSSLVVRGAGFLLNNEMDDFSVKPGHANLYGLVGGTANRIEPHKRMLSSMTPTLVVKNGSPYLILGTPGGSKIITTVAQAIINITRFGMTIEEAVAYPRFHHQWLPDIIYLEEKSFSIQTKQGLIQRGHNLKERSQYGDLEIVESTTTGQMKAASDPRDGGAPAGY